MLTARETKDALIERLLDSPLAAELERSLHDGTEAARRRATQALEDLRRKHEARHAPLVAKARELAERRDALRIEFEAAKLAASEAGDHAVAQREWFAMRSAELQRVARAGAEYLQGLGLDSAEAVEQRFGL